MTADFAPKLAHVLTSYCRPVQPGDHVIIRSTTAAEPLLEALIEAVLKRGGHPSTFMSLTNQSEIFMQHANDDQLAWVNPIAMKMPNPTARRIPNPGGSQGSPQAGPRRVLLLSWLVTYLVIIGSVGLSTTRKAGMTTVWRKNDRATWKVLTVRGSSRNRVSSRSPRKNTALSNPTFWTPQSTTMIVKA